MALVAVLTALIDDVGVDPVYTRVELRRIRAMLCRLYKVPIPEDKANEVAVMQHLAEEDGDAVSEA